MPAEKKFGVAVCRARKCPDLQRDPQWPDSPEHCTVTHGMPGAMSMCVKEMDDELFIRRISGELNSSPFNSPRPGIKNCPEACPYKITMDRPNPGARAKKMGKCAFTGWILGDFQICPCNVLGNPRQEDQIQKVLVPTIRIFQKTDRDDLLRTCRLHPCPDGKSRCRNGGTDCPVIRIPFKDLKECPLWRIPKKLLMEIPLPDIALPAPRAPAQQAPSTVTHVFKDKSGEITGITTRPAQNEKAPSRKSSQKEKPEKKPREDPVCEACREQFGSDPIPTHRIILGDALDGLRSLPDGCVHVVVTSPPYLWLRDYGVKGQIGLEKTVDDYVNKIVEVFREVRRVLRDDGTLFLNIGDSYAGSGRGPTGKNGIQNAEERQGFVNNGGDPRGKRKNHTDAPEGFKAKDMIGIPWRIAFALQEDGWYLRSDIIWSKPNPMPESVTDRPTKSHEYIFLLTKNGRYYYDADGVREPVTGNQHARGKPKILPKVADPNSGIKNNRSFSLAIWAAPEKPKNMKLNLDAAHPPGTIPNNLHKQDRVGKKTYTGFNDRCRENGSFTDGITRNARTVWTINPQRRPEAHFATFPDELARRCIKAGTSEYGCCPKCGAPYRRIVEVSGGTIGTSWHPHENDGVTGQIGGFPSEGYRREFKGWQPGCKCNAGDPVPCVVLDPFAGRGTVAVIARALNRSSIGIELNPEYVKIIRDNLQVNSQLDTGTVRYVFEQAAIGDPTRKDFGPGAPAIELLAKDLPGICIHHDGTRCGIHGVGCDGHDTGAGCYIDHPIGGPDRHCGTCAHHKGRKTFHPTCPRLGELLFKGGTKSAKVLMEQTTGRHPCLFWIPKEADRFGPCPEKNSMGSCMHGAYSCPHKTEEARAAVGCTYPIQPPHYAGDSPIERKRTGKPTKKEESENP